MRKFRLIAICMLAALLLTGCDFSYLFSDIGKTLNSSRIIAYEDMVYERPDMEEFDNALKRCSLEAMRAASLNDLVTELNHFFELYDAFYTNYSLADIRYCADLTNSYWEEEYNFCMESKATVDAMLDNLYRMLAASPMRDPLEEDSYFGADFFDVYEGEGIYDEHYISLMEQEAQLVSLYYTLSNEAADANFYSEEYFSTYGTAMAELFVELVEVRQQIAAYTGFPGYPEYAYANYYRDYTPQQAVNYLNQIGTSLHDLYRAQSQSDVWFEAQAYCSEADTFRYVKDTAEAMGGIVEEAFYLLEKGGLYDIHYNKNKYNVSFETYLWRYQQPFIFLCPLQDQSDKLSFAHEFGHFANDYACGGSYVGTDISEIQSQAFEYLSLCYNEDAKDLLKYKMVSSLSTYVECSAYALFEHMVYDLTDEDLTVENVTALYQQIGQKFGFDSWNWDPRDFVTVSHFFTNPMYVISYVVSNALAMQFSQLEIEEPGAGLALYERCLYSQDSYIIRFAEEYGLVSPFAEGYLESIAEIFASVLHSAEDKIAASVAA